MEKMSTMQVVLLYPSSISGTIQPSIPAPATPDRLEKLFRPTTSFLQRSKSEIIPVLVWDRDEHVLWIDVPVGDVEAVDVGEVLHGLSEHIPHHVLVLVTLPHIPHIPSSGEFLETGKCHFLKVK